MRTWLKRMVAGIVSAGTLMGGGLLMAGTANADEIRMPDIGKTITSLTASAATTYPRELVNGDFEYPSMKSLQHYFTGIDRNRSQWISNGQGGDLAKWSDIPGGLDTTRFGWSSTQTQGAMSEQRANAVELQKATGETTQMGELCASQKGTAIYQDIATTPGTLYRIELDHASRYSIHLDQMQVMVGAPGHEQPVEMTRTSSNKYGDKIGEKSTTIATHSTNPFGNQSSKDDFSHYVGYYTIPAGQSVTRFTFRQVSGVNTTSGNLLDNIVFTQAYKLDYDRNSDEATGQTPNDTATVKPAKTSATGGVRLAADDDVAEYAVNGLPDHLVNGDFEYPVKSDMPANDGKFWYISQNDGSYFANGTVKRYKLPEGFDKAKFAWHSTQTGDTNYPDLERADDVQVDYKADGTNHYSEISAAQSGATIYQDVATVPGAMYKWSLKHASLDSSHLDKMSVIIGEPGKETAQEATRTTANGHGDKLGKVGTVISTKVSNPENKFQEGAHTGQWETYTGTYIATGTVTRFAFHSVEGYNAWNGNLLDDISFSKAYKLTYDKNASDATGSVPSDTTANTVNQAKADATGTVKTVTDTKTKTSGTVKTVADTNASLPGHLVNGDFSVNYKDQWLTGGWNWTSITPDGKYLNSVRNWNDSATIWKTVNGWDKTKFGWSSTQKDGTDNIQHKAGATEIQYDDQADNVYAELCAYEKGTAIYQDIKTVPGVLYKIRLKHASLYSGYLDKMQVLIGAPGHETPVEMTRTSVNGHGDKLNEKSTVIATKVTNGNNRHHESQWETYEGTYLIPDGQATTRFTFKSIDAKQLDRGNVLDDIVFDKAYRLSYDKNASDATGSVPSSQYGKENTVQPAKARTSGTVKTVADGDSSKSLTVNPGFDVPDYSKLNDGGLHWMYVSPAEGKAWSYYDYINPAQPKHQVAGLSQATFGWQELTGGDHKTTSFELHREKDGNVCADVHGSRTIGQTIDTQAGVAYTVSIRHSGRSKGNAGSVQVLVGPDKDHLRPLEMSRMNMSRTGAKYGDRIGKVGTVVTTHSDSVDSTEGNHPAWDHSDDWETYSGTYVATGGKTVFAYRGVDKNGNAVSGTDSAADSVIDDLSFRLAYPLAYDKNAQDATGSVPSNQYGKENTVQPAKAKTTGSVGLAADKTASGLTVHDLKNGEIAPAQYGDFKLSTVNGFSADQVTDVNGFTVKTNWDPTEENQAYAGKILSTMYQPNKNGANLILHHVGQWRDSSGTQRWLNARITVNGQNLGTLVYIPSTRKFVASYGKWDLHPSSRPYMDVTVDFLLDDGSTPQGLRGVTGFTDIDGGTSGYNEGVELVSGFDGAYVRSDAHLTRFGTNGWGGITDENKHDADAHGMKHYVGATFTGSSFRARWSVASGQARQSGFQPVDSTIAYSLTYDKNAQDATGSIPSDTAANTTRPAKSETDGKVSDLVQRTTTHEDGSVTVKTIDTSTDVVSGCQVYYPAGTRITLATAKADSDCWDSSQISRTNRTFYGWSANTDANDRDVPVGDTMDRNTLNANVRTEIVMPARAKTVYALWAINPTLSYNVNAPAGSNAPGTPASQTVPYNTAAADKSGWAAGDTGKIPGYRFDGWYTAPNGGNKYDFNTPLTNNVTVYAHWIGNGYTVRFAGNGATGGGTPDQAFQYNIGQNLHRNGFTHDGYTFTGWKRADNQQAYGDGQWVTNLTTQPNGIVTMVAQWSANEAHIRYNPNPPAGKTAGGNGTPNWDGHTGDTPAISGNGWTIDGYTFAGWTTSPDGSGARYAPGASWTANGTLTLYAQWTPGEAGLTYDGNGATGGKTDPQNGVTDQKVNVRQNGFTRDGYTFVTWNTQADCKGNAVKPNSEWTLRGSSTLYACWAGVAQTLTYHGNGATGGNTAAQSGHTGDELTTNANGFTRDGYTFVRWDTAKDGSGTAYGEGKNGVGRYTMKPAGNDLYAIWQANPASIRYRDDWGATGSTPDTTGVTGQNVTIAQNGFTRPGYTFTGWARDRRTDPSLQPGGRYTLTPGTTTLWAQWKADPAHLIYNANTGSTSQTRRTDGVVDQTLTVIANPFTRTGYTFTGWNTQADGRGRAYTAGNGFRLVADAKSNPVNTSVLYAQWRINRVTLKFNPNGGTGGYPDITADAFTTVTIPADAKEPKVQRPGFRFTGWAMKPTPGAGDTILSPGKGTVSMPDRGSITVYAQWAPAMTTLPFTGGQAQVPTIWLYAGFALMLIALGVMMPMLRMRMAATKRTGKHMPITGGKHAK